MSKLFLVPTPIGNLEDITTRALRVLNEVDLILVEDTRTSGKLLKYFDIATPMQSFHMHNEHKILPRMIDKLKMGVQMALISDAGTPGISDPGFLLVRECVEHDIQMECLPGATALIPAIVQSGFPLDRFVFEGFLPPKKGRQARLRLWAEESRTVVFYESPHKISKTLTNDTISQSLLQYMLMQNRYAITARSANSFSSLLFGYEAEGNNWVIKTAE